MRFSVYVIENPAGIIYIGCTSNLEDRLKRHNNELPISEKSYTKKQGGPWKIIYREEYDTRKEAEKREGQLKTSQGRSFLKKFRTQKN